MTAFLYLSRFNESVTWSKVIQSHWAKKARIQSFSGLFFYAFLICSNVRKYGPARLRIHTVFMQWVSIRFPNPMLKRGLHNRNFIPYQKKKVSKNDDFFTDYFFFRWLFLPTIFLQTRIFSISLLKNTLSLSIRLWTRLKLLTLFF